MLGLGRERPARNRRVSAPEALRQIAGLLAADVLAELRQGYARIEVAYSELSDGAQIRYTTSDPAMVAALHAWFTAQLSDHGGHAVDHGKP